MTPNNPTEMQGNSNHNNCSNRDLHDYIPNIDLLDLYLEKMNEMLFEFYQIPLYRRPNHHGYMKLIAKEMRAITIANNGYIPQKVQKQPKIE